MTDWRAWHADYEDPSTSLARRLAIVRRRLTELLTGEQLVRRILTLCSGDGRDVTPVLAQLAADQRPSTTLVELDPSLASEARRRAERADVQLTVVVGDAGRVDTWQDVAPVDLLMLCGIFGNVSEDDVLTTIRCASAFLNPSGTVIWTRGHVAGTDLRPAIRGWFADAGFEELSYDAEPIGYGVGVNRLSTSAPVGTPPARLFSFLR